MNFDVGICIKNIEYIYGGILSTKKERRFIMVFSKKSLSIFLALIFLFSCFALPAKAAMPDEAVPYYDYTHLASTSLAISSSGTATAAIHCIGYQGKTTKIKAETCLQKKFGLIWVKVDIGTSGNIWTDTTSKYYLNASHTHSVSTGTYRTKVVFYVYGDNDKYEKITVYSDSVKH